jgi:hypothetical protein
VTCIASFNDKYYLVLRCVCIFVFSLINRAVFINKIHGSWVAWTTWFDWLWLRLSAVLFGLMAIKRVFGDGKL